MTDQSFAYSSPETGPDRPDPRLSARKVGQLEPAEQLVLWALRQRLADGDGPSAMLVHGFRLAFGLSALEAALASFEGVFRTLVEHLQGSLHLCPLRCRHLTMDEERILRLLTAAQTGSGPALDAAAAGLVIPTVRPVLSRHALVFGFTLHRVGLDLPPHPGMPTAEVSIH